MNNEIMKNGILIILRKVVRGAHETPVRAPKALVLIPIFGL